jgi:hypothetical protein
MLMCRKHWFMVPRKIQALVWKHYRPGQEIDKNPSEDYVLVQRSAVWAVFVAEGGCLISEVPEIGSRHFMIGPVVMTRRRQELQK